MIIRRALLALLLILLLGTKAHAHDFYSDWLDSWVVGVQGGYADRSASLQSRVRYGAGSPFLAPSMVVRDYSDQSPLLGIFGGYQKTCEQWLVGVELNANWRNVDEEHPYAFSDPQGTIGWSANAHYSQDLMAGITGRIGFAIRSYFMLYARLGVEVSRDELFSTFVGDPNVFPRSVTFNDRRWIYRFLSGVGGEIPVPCAPFTLRIEYSYRSKGKTIEANSQIIDGAVNPLFNTDLQPYMKCFTLGLAWNFF